MCSSELWDADDLIFKQTSVNYTVMLVLVSVLNSVPVIAET